MGPSFIRFQQFGRQMPSSAWWMVTAPGLMLMALAVAILIWPELLAYMVAFLILSLGVTVTGWGLRLRQLERSNRRSQSGQATSQVGQQTVVNPFQDEPKASETVIYYER